MGDCACWCRHIIGKEWIIILTVFLHVLHCKNQLCYATWVTYTWVALLLWRPFLAIESGFVHPCGRNQVVDHSKLKSRDGVFWMEVYQRFSKFAHTQVEKVWSRIILVHNNFFLSYSMFACFNVLVFCYYFFFQLPYHYFNRQTVLTQWAQPSVHSPWSYDLLFFIVTNSMFSCFQMYVKSAFVLVCIFFSILWFFFSPQTYVDSVGATIFTFRVVIQLNVFIAVPALFFFFFFWKSNIFLLQVSTWRRQCGYLPRTSWNDLKTKQTESEGI